MSEYRKKILTIAISLIIVIINLVALSQFNLAYGHYNWKNLAAAYPLPAQSLYIPLVQK
jgi:hypothetical protein